jgi:MFS family permease
MTDTPDTSAPPRYHLKRLFLRTLIASLTIGAIAAVVVLLLGQFNLITSRILLTLGALAFHSGVAMACAAWLERRRWVSLSYVGLWTFAASFVLLIACIWWPGWQDDEVIQSILTTLTLLGCFVLAIPPAHLRDRRQARPLPEITLALCGLLFAMVTICIWAPQTDDITFGKLTGNAAILAAALSLTCVLVRIPTGAAGWAAWVFRGTLASAWLVAALAITAIWVEPEDDLFFRIWGAAGVLAACGSMTLVILAALGRMRREQELTTTPPELELRCPRCLTMQTLGRDKDACYACGLNIIVRIEEPRCRNCDYLLWQLPDRRCPECGTEF